MSVKTLDTNVIIVGGGIAGRTLSSLLAADGIRCLILEQRPQAPVLQKNDPRTLAITRASENILRNAGAWKYLPEDRTGYFRKMTVWEETGMGDIEFNSAELCEPTLGYIIEQNVLEWVLQKANAESSEIDCLYAATVKTLDVQEDRVAVTLEDGKKISSQLIIGADGANSELRRLSGITFPRHDYQQQAVACIVRTEKPHDCVARQRFLSTGPLAFLPMADQYQCGVVWSTSPDHAAELMNMQQAEFYKTLADAFNHTLGAIADSQSRAVFPLQHAQATHYCLPRLALIGDAAHTVHPLAGQGANLGLLDAAALAEIIHDAVTRHQDFGALPVLRRYERWRKGENFLMMKILHGFKVLFESKLETVKYLRNTGLDVIDMLTPVKHIIMRHAMGLSGDLPVFARYQQSV